MGFYVEPNPDHGFVSHIVCLHEPLLFLPGTAEFIPGVWAACLSPTERSRVKVLSKQKVVFIYLFIYPVRFYIS